MSCEQLHDYIFDRGFIYQLITTLITYLIFKLVKFFHHRHDRYKIFAEHGIPGPKPSLLDGHVRIYKKHDCYFKLEDQWRKEYGEFYGVFIGDEPSIITTNLNVLKRVFFEDIKSFDDRGYVFINSPVTLGILFARYPRWKIMRKALSPSFKSYAIRGTRSTQFIEDSVSLMLKYVDNKITDSERNGTKAVIDVQYLMKATALHLISAMAVKLPDVKVSENEENINSLDEYLALTDEGIVLWAVRFPFLRRFLEFLAENFEHSKIMSKIQRNLDLLIDQGFKKLSQRKLKREHSEEQAQIIDTLIKLHYEGKLTRDEVIGNAEAILLAGYDTTSTTIAYTLWVLASDQKLQERLRVELMTHGTESTYLHQVICEVLRLYPALPTFTSRVSNRTVEVDGWVIPAGTRVEYNSWIMHRLPEFWTDPLKFDPERFREGIEYHPCVYAPFGMGDKRCLGFQLAMLEIKMITCDLLLRFKLTLKAPQKLEIVTYARALSKPREKVLIQFEKL